jgi:hypothetical protein
MVFRLADGCRAVAGSRLIPFGLAHYVGPATVPWQGGLDAKQTTERGGLVCALDPPTLRPPIQPQLDVTTK